MDEQTNFDFNEEKKDKPSRLKTALIIVALLVLVLVVVLSVRGCSLVKKDDPSPKDVKQIEKQVTDTNKKTADEDEEATKEKPKLATNNSKNSGLTEVESLNLSKTIYETNASVKDKKAFMLDGVVLFCVDLSVTTEDGKDYTLKQYVGYSEFSQVRRGDSGILKFKYDENENVIPIGFVKEG